MAPQIHIPEQKHIRMKQERDRVLFIVDGKTVLDMPWDATLQLAQHLHGVAKKAEEFAKAQQIVYDQAILTRSGFPIGLSNNRDILKAAQKEAAWNSDLRRYVPLKGIQSREGVGTPTIINNPPKKESNDGEKET